MTKVMFRESLVMQRMNGSGCDDDSCLCTHLQADFAPVSENETANVGARWFDATHGALRRIASRTIDRGDIERGGERRIEGEEKKRFVRFRGKNRRERESDPTVARQKGINAFVRLHSSSRIPGLADIAIIFCAI